LRKIALGFFTKKIRTWVSLPPQEKPQKHIKQGITKFIRLCKRALKDQTVYVVLVDNNGHTLRGMH